MSFVWNMMDLPVKWLNIKALKEWREYFLSMTAWMQAVVFGLLILLAGVAIVMWLWGLRMNYFARFAAGFVSVFFIVIIFLTREYEIGMLKAFLYSAGGGVAGGVLFAFLPWVYQFAAGFVLGDVFATWALPQFFKMNVEKGNGQVFRLVAAVAIGLVFALLAKKAAFLLTALEGGIVVGLLCEVFLPVTKIPFISEKLTKAQILNLLPMVIAAIGFLIQLSQWIGIRREEKALNIPTGAERDAIPSSSDADRKEETAEDKTASSEESDQMNIEEAEAVLVEKAKELALAASRNTREARERDRFADVADGLYSAEVAAQKLGMSEEEFLQAMKRGGYHLPGEDSTEEAAGQDAREGTEAESAQDTAAENEEVDAAPNTAAESGDETAAQNEAAGNEDENTVRDTAAESGDETAAQDEAAENGTEGSTDSGKTPDVKEEAPDGTV